MTFYTIRHRASGRFMPQAKRQRGYSHWNPATDGTFKKALDVPRLLASAASARRCIAMWAACPNSQRVVIRLDGFEASRNVQPRMLLRREAE